MSNVLLPLTRLLRLILLAPAFLTRVSPHTVARLGQAWPLGPFHVQVDSEPKTAIKPTAVYMLPLHEYCQCHRAQCDLRL